MYASITCDSMEDPMSRGQKDVGKSIKRTLLLLILLYGLKRAQWHSLIHVTDLV